MPSHPIRAAVVGVGLAGTVFHLPLLAALPDLFIVHTVVERNPQEKGGKARNFGLNPKVVSTIEEALADAEVELVRRIVLFLILPYFSWSPQVVIGTPNATHYPFAKAALEAGKHGTFANIPSLWICLIPCLSSRRQTYYPHLSGGHFSPGFGQIQTPCALCAPHKPQSGQMIQP